MSGLLPEESIKNRENDTPWKKSQRDKMIDLYLTGGNGASPRMLANKVKRTVKSVLRKLEDYDANANDCIVRYVPFRRASRRKLRFTQNEILLIKRNRAKGVQLKHIARFLCRDMDELSNETAMEVAKTKQAKTIAPMLDLIWAHRYIYYVYKKPVISDKAYDTLVSEEIEYGGGSVAFDEIKKHKGWPVRIKSLALYFVEAASDRAKEAE